MFFFFLGTIYFTSNDGSQNDGFVYQPTLGSLELKKTKTLIKLLAGNIMKCQCFHVMKLYLLQILYHDKYHPNQRINELS